MHKFPLNDGAPYNPCDDAGRDVADAHVVPFALEAIAVELPTDEMNLFDPFVAIHHIADDGIALNVQVTASGEDAILASAVETDAKNKLLPYIARVTPPVKPVA